MLKRVTTHPNIYYRASFNKKYNDKLDDKDIAKDKEEIDNDSKKKEGKENTGSEIKEDKTKIAEGKKAEGKNINNKIDNKKETILKEKKEHQLVNKNKSGEETSNSNKNSNENINPGISKKGKDEIYVNTGDNRSILMLFSAIISSITVLAISIFRKKNIRK